METSFKHALGKAIGALTLGVVAGATQGQELSPRAYWPSPTGTKILTVGYIKSTGDVVVDPSLPISGVESDINTLAVGYRHTTDWFGRTTTLTLEMPFVAGESSGVLPGGGQPERNLHGIGDMAATLSVNLLGAPAMNRQEFQAMRRDPDPILSASVRIVAPTGDYDDERIVNVGANRWAGKLEFGYIQPLHRSWLLEAELGVWIFGDNDDFATGTREQEPIWAAETHLVHRFRPGFWASVDLNYFRGGQSRIGGRTRDDLQRTATAGVTLVFPFAEKQTLKFSYGGGSVRVSDNNFYTFQVSYSRLL